MSDRATGKAEWKAGWPVVAVSAVGVGVGGIHIYGLGSFIIPLGEEYGWSRAQVSSGLSIVSAVSFFFSAFVGYWIDRIGPRRVALVGIPSFCGAIGMLATSSAFIWHWWVNWLLVAFTLQIAKATVWTSAVASRFTVARGAAISVSLSGGGISAAITPALASYLIDQVGWRGAFVGVGCFWAVVAFPLIYLFFYGAQDLRGGRKRDAAEARPAPLSGLGVREALLSARFFKLALAAGFSATVSLGLLVHFIPMMIDAGLDKTNAAQIAGLIGFSSMAGRLGIGFLFDRFHGAVVGAIAFLTPVVACLLMLNYDGSIWQGAICACCIGLAFGTETDVIAYLASRYFGLRNFGSVFGMLLGILSVAIGAGPVLAGAVFDHNATYSVFYWAGVPFALAAAILTATLGRYPVFPKDTSGSSS